MAYHPLRGHRVRWAAGTGGGEDLRSLRDREHARLCSRSPTRSHRSAVVLTLFSADSQTADPDSAGSRPRLRDRLVSIWPLLAAGLLLRLVIAYLIVPGQGLSIDLKNFDDWALTLADYGPGGFYQHAQFAGYPPGYLCFLWPIGIIGRMLAATFGATEYDTVFALLKLPAILADIAIGYLLYR